MLGKYERASRCKETMFSFSIGAKRDILTHTGDAEGIAGPIPRQRLDSDCEGPE